MNLLKYLFFLFFFINLNISKADNIQSVSFADIDLIIQTTEIGKLTLNKINSLNSSNLEDLKKIEKQKNEKKNLISVEEYEKEVSKFKRKVRDFKEKKNEMVQNFNSNKQNELNNLFGKINPIIQNYMNENSVDILLNSKNIFIGSKKLDLTQKLINEINAKVKIDE